jgi:hypothetical protein
VLPLAFVVAFLVGSRSVIATASRTATPRPRRDIAPIPQAALSLATDRHYLRSISRSIPTSTARKVRSSSQSINSSPKIRVLGLPQ